MSNAFAAARWMGIVAVCLLTSGATNLTADALYRGLTVTNIQRVLTDEDVERFTNGVDVQHQELDLLSSAIYAGDVDLSNVDDWLGLEFAQGFDDNGGATGAGVIVSVIDLTDVNAANTHFDELRDELQLVESEQGIGDRFAGLAPQVTGFHTVVLFRVRDKDVLMTSSTTDAQPDPLVTSEGLVDLARIAAQRFER